MATKTELQTLVNTNLASGTSITALEHREVENALINALYPAKIQDTSVTTNVLTNDVLGLAYVINIWKQGNNVNVNGKIINDTGGILSNVDLISITNTEFYPDASIALGYNFYGGSLLFSVTNSNKIKLIDSLGDGLSVSFNFNYKAID